MSIWVTSALLVAAGVVAIPVATFFVECALGATWKPRPSKARRPATARAVIMIPAHDEELGIRNTLEKLTSQLTSTDSVLVIADNCTDATARVARECGAYVLERHHPTERGKGYALSFGTAHLAGLASAPDVVIVLDADCMLTPGSVDALVAECLERGKPMQSDDELVPPRDLQVDVKTKIGMFAFRVKNTLRTRGLDRLGLPRQLAGTGMAFPWPILRDAPNMRGWLTEDLVLGLELAIRGSPAYLCADAKVESEVAPSAQGHTTQRERWEHGHLAAIGQYVPRLLGESLRQGRLDLLVMTLDLAVPPLALLTNVVLGGVALAVVAMPLGAGWLPLVTFSAEATVLISAVTIAWSRVGKDVLTAADCAKIPFYILSKSSSYFRWLTGRGNAGWVRAERRSTK